MLSALLSTQFAPLRMSEIFDPPSASAIVLGNTVYVVMGSMMLLALFGLPLLRGLAAMAGLTRSLARGVTRVWSGSGAGAFVEVERPLHVAGLSPRLANLARQTRTLALELRRRSEAARHWPEDAAQLEGVQVSSWWRTLVSESVDFSPLMDTRREVFDWLDSAANLSEHDRSSLRELGVDIEQVREALTGNTPVAELIRSLAGMLWTIDERLSGATTCGYRANAAQAGTEVGMESSATLAGDDDDDEQQRRARRRFHELLGMHRRGLSRMAGSYARSSAEREDLEQDIALALWTSLPKFRGESKLETFAYRVARYCCYAHARRRARFAADGEGIDALREDDDFEQRLLSADTRAQVQQAVGELPETLESALRLHLSGMSYAEIATQLGITEQNVSVRLTRARRRLEHRLVAA